MKLENFERQETMRAQRTPPPNASINYLIEFNRVPLVSESLAHSITSIQSGHWSGDGPYTQACMTALEEKLSCHRALISTSCTSALEMSALLLDIKPGDEIIMPSYTFVSTANSFVLRGGIPVFVDIRSDNLNIDETKIEAAITPNTKAIVPVHYAGVACEMDVIMDIAKRHKLYVVEDAAQAIFSTYKGKKLGTIGDLGCLSFHATKNIVSGEGGALLINNETFVERAEIIREKGTNRSRFLRGQVDKYTWEDIGSSYLPSDILSALLLAQIERADEIQDLRKQAWDHYNRAFQEGAREGWFQLAGVPEYEHEHNYHMFYLIMRSSSERDSLIEHLKIEGIQAPFHYVPLHSSPAGLKYARTHGEMKFTDDLSGRLVRLPLYSGMQGKEEVVSERVLSFFRPDCNH
jgi:dTDP-4-amino-4,6-dideoxygalactose transaminase